MIVISGFMGLDLPRGKELWFENKEKSEFGKLVLKTLLAFKKMDIQPEDTIYINGVCIQKGR